MCEVTKRTKLDVAQTLEDLWRTMSQAAKGATDEDTRLAAQAYSEALSLAMGITNGNMDGFADERLCKSMELDVRRLVQQYRYEVGTR